MLVEMTSRIMQHSSSRRRVIFFVRMGLPRAFLGKSSGKLLLHVQGNISETKYPGYQGFYCDEQLRNRHVFGRDKSGEAGYFFRLNRKRKPRMKDLWHPG